MYRENQLVKCPFNGEHFAKRVLSAQALPGGAVTALSELVEGAVYDLHFCTDYGIRIALPPEEETWYHVVRAKMTFRGINTAGEAVFDVDGARDGWAHGLYDLGLAFDDDRKWEHHRYLMPV